MNLLRFYLMIGGAKFDATAYSIAAKKNDLHTGWKTYIKNPRICDKNLPGEPIFITESGIPGTYGDGYFIWQSETFNYATEENTFKNEHLRPLSSEYSQLWIPENAAMIEFLSRIKSKMPRVSDYCIGDYFVMFKAIYGYYDDDESCVYPGLSREVIKLLAQIDACYESDSELYEMYFSGLKLKR